MDVKEMKHLIESIRSSLRTENWYAALFIALTLPDICAKMQYTSETSSKKRYVNWFNSYLSGIYGRNPPGKNNSFLSGEDCYALRCSLLHEGTDEISHQKSRQVLDDFIFVTNIIWHRNYYYNDITKRTSLQLSVPIFCEEICSAVEQWCNDFVSNTDVQRQISEMLEIQTGTTLRL